MDSAWAGIGLEQKSRGDNIKRYAPWLWRQLTGRVLGRPGFSSLLKRTGHGIR